MEPTHWSKTLRSMKKEAEVCLENAKKQRDEAGMIMSGFSNYEDSDVDDVLAEQERREQNAVKLAAERWHTLEKAQEWPNGVIPCLWSGLRHGGAAIMRKVLKKEDEGNHTTSNASSELGNSYGHGVHLLRGVRVMLRFYK